MKKRIVRLMSILMISSVIFMNETSAILASSNVTKTEKSSESSIDETNDTPSSDDEKTTSSNNTTETQSNNKTTNNNTTSNSTQTTDNTTKPPVEVKEKGDDVKVKEGDKPYLSLGSDLSPEQKNTVLRLMGVDPAKLSDYDVNYVNNAEEHQYLDSKISSSKIGTRSLSSVVVTSAPKGTGIKISTYNIGYCTVGMYKNALATAGIKDANIIVAAPFRISGTAALVGTFKAYKNMTGKELDKKAVDASLEEIVTTGQLEETAGGKKENIEAMVADLKQQIANNQLNSKEDIKKAIDEAAKKYDVKLSQKDIDKLLELLSKFKDLNIDWSAVKNQAESWAQKLGISMSDASSFWDKVVEFFKALWDFIVGLFN
ncbi:DUF1002 domain-containing protein [Lachnobacterium bovis]|uniref:Uncharacterized protein YpuA, DUF1002 family n=1 Tax=Lachnobacterium bovis TaxID=140626 RepID=A0A1H9TBL6_9FIRM|nr:DUF1002 domain-containing protein [Lachnobacterium bovis]SER94551.1 Uncharacterized protein YpuA, DUF1002 family [Lachnobacterium bovis]